MGKITDFKARLKKFLLWGKPETIHPDPDDFSKEFEEYFQKKIGFKGMDMYTFSADGGKTASMVDGTLELFPDIEKAMERKIQLQSLRTNSNIRISIKKIIVNWRDL